MKINKNSNTLKEKDLIIEKLLTKLHQKDEAILSLEKEVENIKLENEKNLALLFKLQRKLNDVLKDKELINEKRKIERTKIFIPKTEKLDKVVLNEVEEVIKEEKLKKAPGRKKGVKNFKNIDFENSYTETIYEDPILADNISFSDLSLVSSKTRYYVEVIPSKMKVIRVIKRNYKDLNNNFYYPLSNSVFPGSILSPSFASYIAYHKYELGIPFHHLERHLSKTLNINISKQLLATWMSKTANILTPIFNKMKVDLKNNNTKIIHADETTLVVSKRPNHHQNRKKSYVFLYASSYYDRQINIYDFHESRKIDKTASWLKDFKGYLVVDDYGGYNKLVKQNPHIKLQKCFAHVRRKFADILKALPEKERPKTVSYEIVELINKLFYFEAQYKEKTLTATEIIKKREIDQRPIIDKLKTFIFDFDYKANSALKNAINYFKSNWDELLTYFENGHLEISNNLAERAIKPFVINRKVFMTSGSYAGARYTTKIFSIIRTAIINHLDPEKYLTFVLENINKKELDELVPYSKNLPKHLKI